MTRKNTQKYEIYHILSDSVVASGISKTAADDMARGMGKWAVVRAQRRLELKHSVIAEPKRNLDL